MGVHGAAVNVVNNTFAGTVVANRSVSGPEPPCQCTVDHFLGPLKSKMKGLKKIRKKIGLGTCPPCVMVYYYLSLATTLAVVGRVRFAVVGTKCNTICEKVRLQLADKLTASDKIGSGPHESRPGRN